MASNGELAKAEVGEMRHTGKWEDRVNKMLINTGKARKASIPKKETIEPFKGYSKMLAEYKKKKDLKLKNYDFDADDKRYHEDN